MAVRIRLSRIGKKHVPFYRLVAVDGRQKRDGAYLDNLGTYDGIKGTIIQFNEELYNEWVKKGAIPSDSAKRIYRLFKKGAAISATPQSPEKAVKKQQEETPEKETVTQEASKA